jgi:hypothetical protein
MDARKTYWLTVVLAVAAASLASCGGGDDPPPAPADPLVSGTDVPVSATTSADGAFNFVASVAANLDDTGEPLVVGDAVLAVSETDEPKPVQ